jgi:hypothetical protein
MMYKDIIMAKQAKSAPYLEQLPQNIAKKTITVQPCSGKAVQAGVYNAAVKDPYVRLVCQPEMHDDMGISHERFEIPGESKYVLLYQFQNFSQEPCRVTMYFSHQ